jgi:hypothetical protein
MVVNYWYLFFGLYPSSLCFFQNHYVSRDGSSTVLRYLYLWTLSSELASLYIPAVQRSVCVLQCEELILKLYQHSYRCTKLVENRMEYERLK